MKIKLKGLFAVITFVLLVGCIMISIGTDNKAPNIEFGETLPVYKGNPDDSSLFSNVTAIDNRDGDVSSSLYIDTIRVTSDGSHATITYVAIDKANNVAKASQQVKCNMRQVVNPTTQTTENE